MTGALVRRLTLHALIALGVSALYGFGALEFLENRLLDARFQLVQRPPSGDIVHVAIDAASLRELDVWPWPRTFHASLVDRLVAAGAAEIIFDVDFSSRSNEQDDAALAAAFRRADGRVVLPAFKQASDPESTADPLVYTAPLALFRPHVGIAAFNVEADADAVVRRMDWVQTWAGITLPTLAGRTAGVDRPGAPPFLIDYGIRVGTVPRLSYARVLAGEFDATAVAGRRIIVGATAVELVHRSRQMIHRALEQPVVLYSESDFHGDGSD